MDSLIERFSRSDFVQSWRFAKCCYAASAIGAVAIIVMTHITCYYAGKTMGAREAADHINQKAREDFQRNYGGLSR